MGSERLTRWLTLYANVGVLIGIILVIVELDQNRKTMRAQTRHELSMGIVDLLQTPATNEQLADVMYRAAAGLELTPPEQLQYEMRTNALFRSWEDVHYQYRALRRNRVLETAGSLATIVQPIRRHGGILVPCRAS